MASAGSSESPKPRARLMISQLVLENFKSYGGKKVIGPFHKRFSSIVGPNGSGKSNVIDAMLFVFGKRAKKLRLKKVSELIHRSAKYPDLDFARVSVHFQDIIDTGDGDEDYQVVEGSEIIVSRTALRNNTSKYRVDGKEMKFKEVGALLRHRGIDLDHNRFLILQGEVEQISMMRPKAPAAKRETGPASGAGGEDGEEGGTKKAKERQSNSEDGLLEFLEDIIGSNQFVEPIEEAQGALEEAQQARAATINRVKTAQNEAESLKDAKEEAEALLLKQKETLRGKAHMYQVMLAEHSVQREALDERSAAFETRAKEEAERMERAQGQNKELAKEEKAAAKALAAVDARLQASRGQFGAFEKKDIQLREDLKAAKSAAKKTQSAIKREAKKAEESEKRVVELEASIPGLEEQVHASEESKAEADAALEELHEKLQGRTAGLREELSAAEEALAPLAGRKAEAAAALETARAELQVARQESESAREALRKLQTQAAQAEQAASNAARGIEGARSTIARCEGRLPAAQRELEGLREEEKEAMGQVRELRAQVEEGRHALSQGSRSSELVQRLMQATRKGGELAGAGLHGRLGDLGDVPADVDVAVSTAAPALNYLVVDSTEGGQRCIEFLRKHNLGRARFVVLDRIRWAEKQMAAQVQVPDGTSRLFDLVRPAKPQFAPAFFFAMRNTLVASDMDSAIKVAYQGGKPVWRVVTQQGQLIESSGAMSGGGKAVRKGGMRLRSAAAGQAAASRASSAAESGEMVTAEDVARLGRSLAAAEARVGSCRHRISTLEAEVKGLEEALSQAQLDLQKHESAAESLTAQLGDVRARLATAEKAAEQEAKSASKGKAADAIRALESAADAAKRDLDEATQAASAAESRVAALREQVISAGGAALKEAQKASKEAKQALAQAAKALTKAKTDIKTQTRACTKAKTAAQQAEAEVEAQKQKQVSLEQELRDMEEKAADVMESVSSAESDRKEAVSALEKCRAEREAVEKELGSVKSVVVEVESGLKEIRQALKVAVQKSEQWTALLERSRSEYSETVDTLMQFADEEDTAEDGSAGPTVPASGAGASESKEMEDGDGDGSAAGASVGPSTAASDRAAVDRELPALSQDEMARMREEGRTAERLQMEVTALEEEMQRMKDGVNMKAIEEYYSKRRDYLAKVAEMDAASAVEAEKRTAFEGLRKERLDMFMAGFATISLKLKEMYRMITLGGDAELELVDSLDPFNEGIVFSVRPPKKSWKQIANLSGGEKTLSSLALIFALHHYKPTPLYVMDEIDAALDFRNVSIVANYIKERTQDAQFIVISLRNNMFELADRLVGIYKTFDVTKSVTIAPKEFAGPAGKAVDAASSSSGAAATGGPEKGRGVAAAGQVALGDRTNEGV